MLYFRQTTKNNLFCLEEVVINTKQNTFLPSEHDYASSVVQYLQFFTCHWQKILNIFLIYILDIFYFL